MDESGFSYRSFEGTPTILKKQLEILIYKNSKVGTLDIVGMFPNVPVKKTLEVTQDKLEKDKIWLPAIARTKWRVDDIMTLLEILIETYV